MRALLIVLAGAGVLIAGCASMQTEIISDPGRIDSITVGRFTTANPVDNELIGSYLRKELSSRGFKVVNDSPYTLSGTIDCDFKYSRVMEAVIQLGSTPKIVWRFEGYLTRKEFARYFAGQIKKRLR